MGLTTLFLVVRYAVRYRVPVCLQNGNLKLAFFLRRLRGPRAYSSQTQVRPLTAQKSSTRVLQGCKTLWHYWCLHAVSDVPSFSLYIFPNSAKLVSMDEPQKVGSSASSSSDNNKEQGEQNLGQDESETGRSNGRAPAATYPAASSSSYRSTPTGQVSNAGALLMAGGNMQLGSVSTRRNTAAGISRPLGTTNGCSSGGPPTETPALSLLSADSGTLARQGHEALFGEKGGGQLQAGPLQKPVVLAGVPTMLKVTTSTSILRVFFGGGYFCSGLCSPVPCPTRRAHVDMSARCVSVNTRRVGACSFPPC